ncbi:gephyrin-like molybdotransferase Glp [Clostridium sp. C2-6-12]|uniref:molybdopterin molybdotransferase MoeA n=1 Tax=Clostridium sp. C2-6-12 TaxID=2698832 RepID=UPI00136A0D23|nr:gephyrin-like molybdotransferase Glp [Clostridium sp. C2-6-12]
MENIELEKAIEIMLDKVNQIKEWEEINLIEATGRIIEDDIYAPINNPPFDRSPVDGYALMAEDTKGATKENPIKLKVIDSVFAGGYSEKVLEKGQAIRIMTGAKIPKEADCVIRQENTNYDESIVEIYEELSKYDNYCFAGEDINKGSLLIKKGEFLTYVHIGIMASMGISKVKVKNNPKIALLVTGDEVGIPGDPLKEGKIYDSNLHLIYSRLNELGIKQIVSEIIGDEGIKVANKISEIIDQVDFIVTTGGVSVGQKDILHEALPILKAERLFWKVNLKPGTPAMFSLYKNKPILSLSGNPFAALTTFELLARPILAKLSGNKTLQPTRISGTMDEEFNKESKRRRFIRGFYNGGIVKLPQGKHSSGILSSMIGCNCLIDIRKGTLGLKKGDKVNVILL